MDLGLPNWGLTHFFGGWETGVTDAEMGGGGGVIRGKEESGGRAIGGGLPVKKKVSLLSCFRPVPRLSDVKPVEPAF